MKKKLAKSLMLIGVLAMMTFGFVACSTTTCDICGEDKSCDTYDVLGEEINVCGDCENEIENYASGWY